MLAARVTETVPGEEAGGGVVVSSTSATWMIAGQPMVTYQKLPWGGSPMRRAPPVPAVSPTDGRPSRRPGSIRGIAGGREARVPRGGKHRQTGHADHHEYGQEGLADQAGAGSAGPRVGRARHR